MPNTTRTDQPDVVSHEMAELLRAGAADGIGLVCRPGQVQKLWPLLREAEDNGWIRFLDITKPWITEAGRAAVGAPTQAEADYQKMVLLCNAARKPLVPAKHKDPRTDFDYRSYKACGYVCVLAVKAPDYRVQADTVRIIVAGSTQGFGPRNSIIMQESEDPFVVALIPGWLQHRLKLPTYALPLSEDEGWSDAERELWERLRSVCYSINSRIRNAGRGQRERFRFGESA